MALNKAFQDAINEFLMQAGLHRDALQEKVDDLDEKENLTPKGEEEKSNLEDEINTIEEAIDAVESLPE